jgi:hypothetical protein
MQSIVSFVYDTTTGELLATRGWGRHDIELSTGFCLVSDVAVTGLSLNGHETSEVKYVFLGGKRYMPEWVDDTSCTFGWRPRAQRDQAYTLLGETAECMPPTLEEKAETLDRYRAESGNENIALICVRTRVNLNLGDWVVDLNTKTLVSSAPETIVESSHV